MRENTEQKNPEYGYFSRSVMLELVFEQYSYPFHM